MHGCRQNPHVCPSMAAAKECGLHSGNVAKSDGSSEARKSERDLWISGSAVEGLSKASIQDVVDGKRDKNTLLVLYAPWCPFCQVRGCGGGGGAGRGGAGEGGAGPYYRTSGSSSSSGGVEGGRGHSIGLTAVAAVCF